MGRRPGPQRAEISRFARGSGEGFAARGLSGVGLPMGAAAFVGARGGALLKRENGPLTGLSNGAGPPKPFGLWALGGVF